MFIHTRGGGVVLLTAIIASAGYTIWAEGPGKAIQIRQRNSEVLF